MAQFSREAFLYARNQMLEFLRDAESVAEKSGNEDIRQAFLELRLRISDYTRIRDSVKNLHRS